ncbi:MAG: TolB-like translocation protein [Acidimicrobiales bacterium]
MGRRLMAVDADGSMPRCLVGDVPVDHRNPRLRWRGAADGVLVSGASAILRAGPVRTQFDASADVSWSRPKGIAVLAVASNGHLLRHDIAGGAPLDVTFLAHHESALYHPAGRDIVSVGTDESGVYGIFLATNRGANRRTLARGETARHLVLWGWTVTGNLLFTADHGDRWDLHQLNLASGQLVTLDTASPDEGFGGVSASTLPGGGVAWAKGACRTGGGSPRLSGVRGGEPIAVPTSAAQTVPVGWLPGGTLVVTGCRDGALSAIRAATGEMTRLADGSGAAAVRVVLPPGPDLPPALHDDAPP